MSKLAPSYAEMRLARDEVTRLRALNADLVKALEDIEKDILSESVWRKVRAALAKARGEVNPST